MYSEPAGRVELRCSLPKLMTGRNDELLDATATHDALRHLAAVGSDAIGVELNLREGRPTRLDLVYDWEVDSVTETLDWIERGLSTPRRLRTRNVSPRGGTSYVVGYGSGRRSRVLRFYDKGAEAREKKETTSLERDKVLRFELQEQRPEHLALVHEDGYTPGEITRRLQKELDPLSTLVAVGVGEYLDRRTPAGNRRRISSSLGYLHLAQNPQLWGHVRERISESSYHELRANARRAMLAVTPWWPAIPLDAYGPEPFLGIWPEDVELAA